MTTERPIEDVTEQEQPAKRHGDALEEVVAAEPEAEADDE